MASSFVAWNSFYVITGSSAAALTGLMFVVITLLDGRNRPNLTRDATATYSTPTVVHFGTAFLISALASVPWPTREAAMVVIACVGAAGIVYAVRITVRMVRFGEGYAPDADDVVYYAALPFVSYAAVAFAGLALGSMTQTAFFALAGAVLLLILLGIRNAWDIVTYIAIMQHTAEQQEQPR